MLTSANLIDELEDALANGSNDHRVQTLERVTDLFLLSAERYSEDQIDLFDDVLRKITARIEAQSLAKLSSRLAGVPNAPRGVIRQLARHDDISVARPVLAASDRLDESDLVETARTKSQQHLLAISERRQLSEAITDVLVERGDREVVRAVVRNNGARFSNAGFRTLVTRSSSDDVLAFQLGARRDLPRSHFIKLVEKASANVRDKLIAANPRAAAAIKDAIAEAADGFRRDIRNASAEYAAAKAQVEALFGAGALTEEAVYQFARERKFEHTVVALSLLCGVEADVVERAMTDPGAEILLILAKFAGLSWTTAKAILLLQGTDRAMSAHELATAMRNFTRIQDDTARQVLSFYRSRHAKA